MLPDAVVSDQWSDHIGLMASSWGLLAACAQAASRRYASYWRWLPHWVLPVALAVTMGGVIGGISSISSVLALAAMVGLSFCLIALSR